ncbi:MAG: DUF4105 domain-containing protein, partial [Proteobacteria bacterium]|nr:DUF4105 domain-containing protein [Pseudomonadota bacterium]
MGKSALVYLASALFSFSTFASPSFDSQLAFDPYWHKLLHYEKTLGGFESQADGIRFFLSSKCKENPEAELIANIELLFDTEKKYENPNDHPACKFPLRYEWLKNKLNIQTAKPECPEFESWNSRLGATGLSLIFASSYTNNPASMFGHTFLRVKRVQNGQELPPLLSYTVNFAAETGSEKGMLYTVKGLFGAYPGHFSTFPYYQKIQQYNNWESRDIWEYDLNLSDVQLHNIILHLWEMGSTHFNYFFGDENCSYFLLALLEAADDGTQLRKYLPFFTIPVDTLKIVSEHTQWIVKDEYRASLRRQYQKQYGLLDGKERVAFEKLYCSENLSSVDHLSSDQSKANVLDSMIDFHAMKQKQNTKTDFQKQLLQARSEVPVPTIEPEIERPSNPLESHPSMRVGLGGSRLGGGNFAHLDFRGAYHDLIDNPAGFDPAAQIQSLSGRIRVSTDNGDVDLDHLKIIEVVSLSPVQKYLTKQSWNIGFGWRKNYSNSCFNCGALYIEGGSGITLGNTYGRRFYFTTFLNGFFQAGPWNSTQYQIGPSGTSMIIWDTTQTWRFLLTGNVRYSPLGSPEFIYKGSLESALDLSKRVSLRGWANQYKDSREYGGSLLYYF